METELEWYDRSSEDRSIPFFGRDADIKELLLSTPYLKAAKTEISAFCERHEEKRERTRYIKDIFNSGNTELTLEDGRRAGYKAYQNGLHIYGTEMVSACKVEVSFSTLFDADFGELNETKFCLYLIA